MNEQEPLQSGALISLGEAATDDVRTRIISAATELIGVGGRSAATTRRIAAAAGVQAPTIYRLFGDMSGLLSAVAGHAWDSYVSEKLLREPHPDAVQDLRDGWDVHIDFGLGHPGLFAIMSTEPPSETPLPSVAEGRDVLRQRIKNIALAGRLRVGEERALALLQSMGVGTVLTLLGQPVGQRDPGLSAVAREAIIAAITVDAPATSSHGPSRAAATLNASLDQTGALTDGERHLLSELLTRIANEV